MQRLRNSKIFGYLHTYFVFRTRDETQTGQASKLLENPLKSLISMRQSLIPNEILSTKFLNKMENQFKIQEICKGVRGTG